MAHDVILTVQDLHPRIGAQHVVPSLLRVEEYGIQGVRRLPALLAFFQLGSMMFLHFQGFYWFSKILVKGDLRKDK